MVAPSYCEETMRTPSCRRIVLAAAACLLLGSCLEAPTSPIVERPDGRPSSQSADQPTAGINFEALTVGDSALLHFQSDGCFHHFVGDVVLTRTESGLAVRVMGTMANLAPGWRFETPPT